MNLRQELIEFGLDWYKENPVVGRGKVERMIDKYMSSKKKQVLPVVNQLCFAWYPKNKSVSTDMEMYYCLPLEIGKTHSKCILFFGNEPEDLQRKGMFSDVCTADLKCI